MQKSGFQQEVLSINSKKEFENVALRAFRFQAERNEVYSNYIAALKIDINSVSGIEQIPFLPIEFFKTHRVASGDFEEQVVFSSSGTTGTSTSRHFVRDVTWYEQVFLRGFELFYGIPEEYCILALLPSYLERSGSSLIVMVQKLIEKTGHNSSGFYLNNHKELAQQLKMNEAAGVKTILLGVTFGLLDFVEGNRTPLNSTIVMETGGMKGRRREMTREEVTDVLTAAFSISEVHSEYGMTELLSQAYSSGNGVFRTPPWMKLMVRDVNDPLDTSSAGKGVLNVIDLANIDSCAFIATQDVGEVYADESFRVLGRMDQSDVRGCNLLII